MAHYRDFPSMHSAIMQSGIELVEARAQGSGPPFVDGRQRIRPTTTAADRRPLCGDRAEVSHGCGPRRATTTGRRRDRRTAFDPWAQHSSAPAELRMTEDGHPRLGASGAPTLCPRDNFASPYSNTSLN